MSPQDFKALLDELKEINENLNLLWKAVYLLRAKEEKNEKTKV